jgi:photosystem II 13kDa protein
VLGWVGTTKQQSALCQLTLGVISKSTHSSSHRLTWTRQRSSSQSVSPCYCPRKGRLRLGRHKFTIQLLQYHEPRTIPLLPLITMKSFSSLIFLASVSLSAAFTPVNPSSTTRLGTLQLDATIQFVRGLDEKVVPDVKLTRARDGGSGVATFTFKNPNVFDASTASMGEILGMFMIDDEGEISTTSVNARFANGKPQAIESVYTMTSPEQWDRFMRFMERYAQANDLGFKAA